MEKVNYKKLSLVYSCSGSSSAGQLAHLTALDLDFSGITEMSCIAGVGGGVKSKVKLALEGREIIALYGCSLNCVKSCLAKIRVDADHHFTLTEMGYKKQYHKRCDLSQIESLKKKVESVLSSKPIV